MTVPLSLNLDSLAIVCVDIYMHVRVFLGGALVIFFFLNDRLSDM